MDRSIHINWMSPFSVVGMSGVFFIFILFRIDIPVSKQWRPWSEGCIWSGSALFAFVPKCLRHLIWVCTACPCPKISAASDLGLHCLPMSKKWDANLHSVFFSYVRRSEINILDRTLRYEETARVFWATHHVPGFSSSGRVIYFR